jgi:ribosomal protein S18 acetylase RimI-like enzyme
MAIATRPATAADLGPIAGLHVRAFRGFFLTQLGRPFLVQYYRAVLEYTAGILLIAEVGHSAAGFVAGFCRPNLFYRSLRRRALSLGIAMAPALLRHPAVVRRALADFRRTGANESPDDACLAELSSLAVEPATGGRGVGKALVIAFVEAAAGRGAGSVYLTTDAVENDAVNRFYCHLGFETTRTFEAAPGRFLNEMRLEVSPRGCNA